MAHEILVSAQGPLGFWVLGLRVWGQGLTIMFSLNMMVWFLNIEIGTDQVSYNSTNTLSFNTPQIENDALASVHNRQPAGIP